MVRIPADFVRKNASKIERPFNTVAFEHLLLCRPYEDCAGYANLRRYASALLRSAQLIARSRRLLKIRLIKFASINTGVIRGYDAGVKSVPSVYSSPALHELQFPIKALIPVSYLSHGNSTPSFADFPAARPSSKRDHDDRSRPRSRALRTIRTALLHNRFGHRRSRAGAWRAASGPRAPSA